MDCVHGSDIRVRQKKKEMIKKICVICLWLISILHIGLCQAFPNSKQKNVLDSIHCNDTLRLNAISELASNSSQTKYSLGAYSLSYTEQENSFTVINQNRKIGYISLGNRYYEGPGFQIYKIYSADAKYYVILVEALADIGTAWYNATLWYEDRLISSIFIDDPRANSDITKLNDFIAVFVTDNSWIIRLNKKWIANYSRIPAAYKTTMDFVHIITLYAIPNVN